MTLHKNAFPVCTIKRSFKKRDYPNKKILLIHLSSYSPIQTSPNCPAPSFFTILMDSLEISQASLSHGFWAFGFTQGRFRFRQSPSALSAGGTTVPRDYSTVRVTVFSRWTYKCSKYPENSWKSGTIFRYFGTLWSLVVHTGVRFSKGVTGWSRSTRFVTYLSNICLVSKTTIDGCWLMGHSNWVYMPFRRFPAFSPGHFLHLLLCLYAHIHWPEIIYE